MVTHQKLSLTLKTRLSQNVMMTPQMQLGLQVLRMNNQQLEEYIAEEILQNPFLEAVETKNPGDVIETQHAQVESLSLYLLKQISEELRAPALKPLCTELVYWLDEEGYLRDDNQALCKAFSVSEAELQSALDFLRGLSPLGVFARDLSDRLKIQIIAAIKQREVDDVEHLDIILTHFSQLMAGNTDFFEQLGIPPVAIGTVLQLLQNTKPYLSDEFSSPQNIETQIPDILIIEEEGDFIARLNDETLPQFLVLDDYWETLAARPARADEKEFLRTRYLYAQNLQMAVTLRATTLLRVANALIERQLDFLRNGMMALAPMKLVEIADDINMNDSTVSRAIANKFILTPQSGLLAVRDLFTASLEGGVSAGAVKARIKQLISEEEKILSDNALTNCLADEGIKLSRRTVMKYREALGISSSVVRRKARKLNDLMVKSDDEKRNV